MAWTLFRQTLYQRRTALLWYSISLISYSVFIVWYFPFIQKIDIQSYINALPKDLITAFAGSSVSLSTFGGYIATEYLGLVWVLIIGAAAITFATKCLSAEMSAGTMELVLAQPVSRVVLVVARWLAMVVYLAVLVLSTTVPVYLTALWRDVKVDAGNLALVSAVALVFALAIGGAAYILAALFRESGRAAGIIGGILGAMWVLSFMAANLQWARSLNPVNLFHYWEPARMVDKGTVATGSWVLYGVLALLGPVVAAAIFSRRDVG